MSKNAARAAAYLLLCIPLIVVAVLIIRQIEFAFNLRKAYIDSSLIPYSDVQQVIAANEITTRSFFLIFICFLMILFGLLIILRGTENALQITKEVKARYSLKATYPGMIMAVAGCLFLAYAVYKSSQLQFQTTAQLVKLKANSPVAVSTPDSPNSQKNDDPKITKPEGELSENKIRKDMVSNAAAQTSNLPVSYTSSMEKNPVTEKEMNWAEQLALKSVVYNYSPTNYEKETYSKIVNRILAKDNKTALNEDIHWAFSFLLKTKNGYQPSPEELNKYEEIVHLYLTKGKQLSTVGNFPSRFE